MNALSYRWWWTKFGGRPWTFILRDIWHKAEIIPQMFWLITGAICYGAGGWRAIGIFVAVYAYGYLQGHLKWGKPYIPNQQGGK